MARSMHLLLLSVVAMSAAATSDVVDLTDANFDSELEAMDTTLVMFYAPWCGHCKKLKPEFEKSASDLSKNEPQVYLAKIDCTEEGKDTCGRFEVRGYPTLKIFRGGEFSADYNGPREAAGISKYMKAQVGPAVKELAGMPDFEALLKIGTEPRIVGVVSGDSDFKKTYHKLADGLREEFSFCTVPGDKEGLYVYRAESVINKKEANNVKFDGKLDDKSGMKEFVTKNYHGLVGFRSMDNAKYLSEAGKTVVVAYYDVDYVKNTKGTNYWRNRVMKVAKDFDNFRYAVSNKHDFQHELSEFGVDYVSGDKPVVAARGPKGQKYKMEGDFSVESFTQFMKDLDDGKVEQYMKSEAVPDNSGNAVKVAVGKNFDELVMKSEKDVLIEFYAPWCGHCKKLTPVYDELGEKMKAENVEIVKMDATANDVPSTFDVRGFPTLYWLPKGSKTPVSYGGGREVDDFVQYIAKEASDELSGWDRSGKPKKEEL